MPCSDASRVASSAPLCLFSGSWASVCARGNVPRYSVIIAPNSATSKLRDYATTRLREYENTRRDMYRTHHVYGARLFTNTLRMMGGVLVYWCTGVLATHCTVRPACVRLRPERTELALGAAGCYGLPVAGCWLLVAGCWLLPDDCWRALTADGRALGLTSLASRS